MVKKNKEKKDNPIVKELLDVFGKSLLSVCKIELKNEDESPVKEGELKIHKTEEQLIAIINDKADSKVLKLVEKFKNKKVQVLLLSSLWQSCYDQKFDLIRTISNPKTNQIMYDKGFIKSLIAAELLRSLTLEKLNRYILSMILVGSVSRGTMKESSDVDVIFVIDDTDVKRMPRAEVLARLRRIIHEKAQQTGFEFNLQVYLLTDFWQSLRDTHPVIFSMVRDGVPLHDVGMFIPWQTLLKTGKLKPSPEAVDQFYRTGTLLIDVVKDTVKDLVVEKLFLAMLNPAQAALMLIGLPPTDHNNTPKVFKKHFVNDLKLIEQKYVDYLQEIMDYRKNLEHGKIKEISIDEFVVQMKHAQEFQKRVEKLFQDIRTNYIKKVIDDAEKESNEAIIQTLKSMGIKATKNNTIELLKTHLLDNGLIIGTDYVFVAKRLVQTKANFKKNLLTTEEAYLIEKEAKRFINVLKNVKQIYDLKNTKRARIHFNYGSKNGEVWLLNDELFIVKDLKQPENDIVNAKLEKDGSFGKVSISNMDALKKARKEFQNKNIVNSVKPKTLESVKSLISGDIEFVFM